MFTKETSITARAFQKGPIVQSTEFSEKSHKSRQCVFMLSEQLLTGNVTKSKMNGPYFFCVYIFYEF